MQKHYQALVHGNWADSMVEVDAPLKRIELESGERIVRVDPEGKAARTRYRVLKHFRDATLIEAMPETGRTHQIRVHCLSTGHPIVGDSKYAHGKHREGLTGALARNEQLCLHASKVRFLDPASNETVEIEAPLRKEFLSLLEDIQE